MHTPRRQEHAATPLKRRLSSRAKERFFVPTLRVQVLGTTSLEEREEKREREGERTRKTVQTSGVRLSLFSLLVFSWFLTTISVCGGSLSLFSVDGGPLTDNVVLNSVQRIFRARSRAEALWDNICELFSLLISTQIVSGFQSCSLSQSRVSK